LKLTFWKKKPSMYEMPEEVAELPVVPASSVAAE